jgi:DNA repair protein RadC
MKQPADRCLVREVQEAIVIDSAQQAGEYLLKHIFVPWEQFEQEEFHVFLLNCRRRITHHVMVYRGTIDAIRIRQAELFRTAIRLNAWGILMTHNHPSGQALPSSGDVEVYRASQEAGKLLGIEVIDHIVVGHNTWQSLRERAG